MKENLLLLKYLLGPYKYANAISKDVCIDKLDNIVNKYHNTYHRTIKVKPIGVKSSTYIDFDV